MKTTIGTTYLSPSESVSSRLRTRSRNFLAPLMMLCVALLVGVSALLPLAVQQASGNSPTAVSSQKAEAISLGLLCSNEGSPGFFVFSMPWRNFLMFYPNSDAPSRTWTMQEAYGNAVRFIGYNGENGEGSILVNNVGKERGKGIGNFDEVLTKLESVRTPQDCLLSIPGLIYSNLYSGIAQSISFFTQMITTATVSANIICEDPANPKGICINLLKVIGGDGSGGSEYNQGGVIGALTASVYMPLIVIVAAIAGLSVMWTAFAQRKYRDALFKVVWIVLSFVVGLAILLNPSALSRAPMAASNAVAACVIGSFNGQNCMDSGSTGSPVEKDKYTSDKVCVSEASGIPIDKQAAMTINSLNCSIWKAFVLEPWSQAQFGRSFSEMDTSNEEVAKVLQKAKLSADDFRVPLKSSKSVDDQDWTLQLDDTSTYVSNIAAYQLFLMTPVSSNLNPPIVDKPGSIDKRWMKLAVFAGNSDQVMNSWGATFNSALSKWVFGVVMVISTILGGIILIVAAMFALIYLLTSIIMLAFAPLFALVGVHPGKGRSIFIGWLETILSNLLKYFASVFFLIVTIALYGGVLGTVSNPGMSLLFTTILTAALWMYRKELIELFGKVNMGGQRLSSRFSDKVRERFDRAREFGTSVAGGAFGGVLANGTAGGGASAAWTGMRDAAKRDLSRGNNAVAKTMRTSSAIQADNKRDLAADAKVAESRAEAREQVTTKSREEVEAKHHEMETTERTLIDQESEFNRAIDTENDIEQVEHEVAVRLTAPGEIRMKLDDLTAKISVVKSEGRAARAAGDEAGVARARTQLRNLQNDQNKYSRVAQMDDIQVSAAVNVQQIDNQLRRFDALRAAADTEEKRNQIDGVTNGLRAARKNYLSQAGSGEDVKAVRDLYQHEYADAAVTAGVDNVDREKNLQTISNYENTRNSYSRTVEEYNESADKYAEDLVDSETAKARADRLREEHTNLSPGERFTRSHRKNVDEMADVDADMAETLARETNPYTQKTTKDFSSLKAREDNQRADEKGLPSNDKGDDPGPSTPPSSGGGRGPIVPPNHNGGGGAANVPPQTKTNNRANDPAPNQEHHFAPKTDREQPNSNSQQQNSSDVIVGEVVNRNADNDSDRNQSKTSRNRNEGKNNNRSNGRENYTRPKSPNQRGRSNNVDASGRPIGIPVEPRGANPRADEKLTSK